MPTSRAVLAEFIGTFALVLVGAGAIIVTGGSNLVAIALAPGLILAVMVTATAHISGGQLNPAVSIGLALIGRQPWSRAIAFIVGQLTAAIFAALLLKTAYAGSFDLGNLGATLGSLSQNEIVTGPAGRQSFIENPNQSIGLTVLIEIIATFFLMFVFMGTAVDQRGVAKTTTVTGLAIGLAFAANILAFGALTGASMNPARSFGPALVGGHLDMHWVYWVAPIVGAALAAFTYDLVFRAKDEG